MNAAAKPPVSFWIISVLALLWNLMGVMMYIVQVTMTPEAIQALPAKEQELFINVPMWVMVAFAVAVFGSTLGSILLLIKRKLAIPVFIISYVAIIVQMINQLFISKSIEVYGPGGAIMPVMVIMVGAFLIWYSRKAAVKGWLN